MKEDITGIGGMIFVFGIFLLITIVVVVVISQALKNARAKAMNMAEIARDEAYRKLAEEAISVQKKISEDMSDLRIRVAAIEKILREVE